MDPVLVGDHCRRLVVADNRALESALFHKPRRHSSGQSEAVQGQFEVGGRRSLTFHIDAEDDLVVVVGRINVLELRQSKMGLELGTQLER